MKGTAVVLSSRAFGIIGYVGIAGIAVLALMTGADVAGRFLFNSPILGVYELSEVTLAIVGALGIAQATATEEHIAVDVVYERVSAFWQRALILGGRLAGVAVFGVLAWQGILAMNREETTTLLGVPIWPVRLVVVLGFLLSAIFLIGMLAGLPRQVPDAEVEPEGVL